MLSEDLINRVAAIFVSHLRYETPVGKATKEKTSHLSFTKPSVDLTPVMPVDSECADRLEALVSGSRMSASSAKIDDIRFPEEEVVKLFSTPTISEETSNMVRAESSYSGSGTFKDFYRRKVEELWSFTVKVARAGMKLSSILLLTAESLIRVH